MKTITFEDGYTVTVDRHVVTFSHGGKERLGHVTHWKPVPENSAAAAFLEKQGKDIADYLLSEPTSRWIVVRAGNGVREAIQESLEDLKRIESERSKAETHFRRGTPSK